MTPVRRHARVAAAAATAAVVWSADAVAAPESVRFNSTDAQATPIAGLLYRPAGAGPFPAVVMMHGCSGLYAPSGKVQTNLAAWAERLVGWGYVVLAVDSFTPRGFREICTRHDRPLSEFEDRPFDAYGGLAYLRTQPFVRGDRVALIGWSNGAMATLAALAEHARQRFRPPTPGFRAGLAFYPGCALLRQAGFRPSGPVHLFVGLADDWTRAEPCLELVRAVKAGGADIGIDAYPGAYHAFDHPNLPLRTRKASNAAWKEPTRSVHIGSDPAARADAVAKARAYLARHLDG